LTSHLYKDIIARETC